MHNEYQNLKPRTAAMRVADAVDQARAQAKGPISGQEIPDFASFESFLRKKAKHLKKGQSVPFFLRIEKRSGELVIDGVDGDGRRYSAYVSGNNLYPKAVMDNLVKILAKKP